VAKLEAPKNGWVLFLKSVVDKADELGEGAAYAFATAALPWLGAPIIGWLFKLLISFLMSRIGRGIFNLGAKKIIFVQGEVKSGNVIDDNKELKKSRETKNENPELHAEKLEKMRDSVDDFIHRGKRP